LQTPPDNLRPHPTFAVVAGSPPDSPRPAQTPCPCLGVKGVAGAAEGEGEMRTKVGATGFGLAPTRSARWPGPR
jgi:hypothetical protein